MLENDENKLTNVVRSSHLAHVQHHHQGIQKGHRLLHTHGHIMDYNKNYHCTRSFAQGNSKSNKMAAAFSM